MTDIPHRDDSKINWASASADYARFRPGPPPSFYRHLEALGVGLPGQHILDLGCGPGQLALQFARQGCVAAGIDPDAGQIREAQATAQRERLAVDFRVAPAEATTHDAATFDALTANHCWWYFDAARALAEAKRVSKPGAVLVVSFFSWFAKGDPIVKVTQDLILTYNPNLPGADWSGEVPSRPSWLADKATQRGMFWYDEPIPFSHMSWRGRARANRAIGASLPPEQVQRFDAELAGLLRERVPDPFTAVHRIAAFLVVPN